MEIKKAYFKYIASLLLFGLNGIVASYIKLSSYEIVFTRTLVGSILLALIFAASHRGFHMPVDRAHFTYVMISGVAMGASWMFLYEAYRRLGVGTASLANYCGPVIVMALSPFLFQEKLTATKVIGFLAVLSGMICINIGALSEGRTPWGLFCGIMSAVMYAVMLIFNKKAKSVTGLENSMWQLISSFLTVSVFLFFRQGFSLHIEPGSILPILLLGIVNTGVGCYFYFSSIGGLPVQTVAICGYLEPLSAVLFSAIFLREEMGAAKVAGAALILGGAAFGELFRRRITVQAGQS